MAVSTIKVDVSNIKTDATLASGVNLYRRGNAVTIHVANVAISNTQAVTLLGTVPSGCAPPTNVYASGFASGVVSYVYVDSAGKVYGYRSVAGNLLASVTYVIN